MAIVTAEVLGSDGVARSVVGDLIGDNFYPIYKLTTGDLGTDDNPVSADNPLPMTMVRSGSIVDSGNSTTTPLDANDTFTGTGRDLLGCTTVSVTVMADVDSAADGMTFQFSTDNVNWDDLNVFELDASESTTRRFQFPITARFYRFVYTNGVAAQTEFRVQTILHTGNQRPSVHRLKDAVNDDRSVSVVKSVVFAQQAGGGSDFIAVQATNGGNFKVSLEEIETDVEMPVKGTVAHDSPDTDDAPIKIGGRASTSVPAIVGDGDSVRAYFDTAGRLQVNMDKLPLTAFGDLRTAELTPVFQGTFEYTVTNTEITTTTITNGGTVTQANAMAVVGTSTTTNSTALLQSNQHAKYRAGLGGVARFTGLFTAPVAATEQYIGIADETGSSAAFMNGYMVGYDGLTFGLHRFSNDVKISIAQANWDDPLDGTGASGMTLDQTKINVFFVQFQYLGGGAVKLFMESQTTGDVILVHTIDYANLNTEPSVHNPNFVFTIWTNNKATTSDLIIRSSSYGYFIEGKTRHMELHTPTQSTGEQQKLTVTTEVAIVTIRNKALFATKTNFIDILILLFSSSVEANAANNLAKVRLVKNATLGGTPSFSDINTTDSVVEFDTAGTTVTGGVELDSSPLAGKNDKSRADISNWQITLKPGETLTVAGSSANEATINAGLVWQELF